jgi:Fic family protein
MAYIHVKRIGDKKYYTLRISVRKGDKVIAKDLCNLGSDLSEIKIENLEKKYKKEIRKSYRTIKKFLDSNYYLEKAKKLKQKKDDYFTKEQLEKINAINLHYQSKFLKLDELSKEEILDNFLVNFAVNSTSIEGNTINLKQAQKLFQEDLVPKDKKLREVYDLKNTKKVVNFLKDKKEKITIKLIEEIHDMLLEGIDKRKGIRTHDIKILGQAFKSSPARYVKADLGLFLKWYEKNKNKFHPLILATLFHHKFEKIHPFSDGNGRTGRILINYILNSFGYPPLIISMNFRKEYLDVMNEPDNSLKKGLLQIDKKDYKKLIDFIHSQFEMSYWDFFLF